MMGRWSEGDYDAIYHLLSPTDTDPAGNLDFWLSSGGSHVWNPNQSKPATDWERTVDELMRKQATSLDQAERLRLFGEVQRIFAEHLPAMTFAVPHVYVATSARVGASVDCRAAAADPLGRRRVGGDRSAGGPLDRLNRCSHSRRDASRCSRSRPGSWPRPCSSSASRPRATTSRSRSDSRPAPTPSPAPARRTVSIGRCAIRYAAWCGRAAAAGLRNLPALPPAGRAARRGACRQHPDPRPRRLRARGGPGRRRGDGERQPPCGQRCRRSSACCSTAGLSCPPLLCSILLVWAATVTGVVPASGIESVERADRPPGTPGRHRERTFRCRCSRWRCRSRRSSNGWPHRPSGRRSRSRRIVAARARGVPERPGPVASRAPARRPRRCWRSAARWRAPC